MPAVEAMKRRFATYRSGLVSFVVIVRNGVAAEVAACLGSIAAQDQPESCELVLVDDGSDPALSEHYARAAEEVVGHVLGVRVVRLPRAVGIPRARSVGAALADGEWLAIVDADDLVMPGWASAVLNAGPDTHLVYADHEVFDASGMRTPRRKSAYARLHRRYWGTVLDPLFSCAFLVHPQAFRLTSLLRSGGFERTHHGGEEASAHIVMAALGPNAMLHVDDVMYRQRRSANGVTSDAGYSRGMVQQVEQFLVAGARRQGHRVATAEWAGRAQSTGAAHFRLRDDDGEPVVIPWFDYDALELVGPEVA